MFALLEGCCRGFGHWRGGWNGSYSPAKLGWDKRRPREISGTDEYPLEYDSNNCGCGPIEAESGRHDNYEPCKHCRHHPLHHLIHLLLLATGGGGSAGGYTLLDPHGCEDDGD